MIYTIYAWSNPWLCSWQQHLKKRYPKEVTIRWRISLISMLISFAYRTIHISFWSINRSCVDNKIFRMSCKATPNGHFIDFYLELNITFSLTKYTFLVFFFILSKQKEWQINLNCGIRIYHNLINNISFAIKYEVSLVLRLNNKMRMYAVSSKFINDFVDPQNSYPSVLQKV